MQEYRSLNSSLPFLLMPRLSSCWPSWGESRFRSDPKMLLWLLWLFILLIKNQRNMLAQNFTFWLSKGPYLQSKIRSISREISSNLLNGDSEYVPWCLLTGIAAETSALRQWCGKKDYILFLSLFFRSSLGQNAVSDCNLIFPIFLCLILMQKDFMSCLNNAQ